MDENTGMPSAEEHLDRYWRALVSEKQTVIRKMRSETDTRANTAPNAETENEAQSESADHLDRLFDLLDELYQLQRDDFEQPPEPKAD